MVYGHSPWTFPPGVGPSPAVGIGPLHYRFALGLVQTRFRLDILLNSEHDFRVGEISYHIGGCPGEIRICSRIWHNKFKQ